MRSGQPIAFLDGSIEPLPGLKTAKILNFNRPIFIQIDNKALREFLPVVGPRGLNIHRDNPNPLSEKAVILDLILGVIQNGKRSVYSVRIWDLVDFLFVDGLAAPCVVVEVEVDELPVMPWANFTLVRNTACTHFDCPRAGGVHTLTSVLMRSIDFH